MSFEALKNIGFSFYLLSIVKQTNRAD